MSRIRPLRTAAATCMVLLVTAAPALAHTTVSPGAMEPGETATLTFRAPGERPTEGHTVGLRVLVPEQFTAGDCEAPVGWTCAADTETHAPHTVVAYTAPETGSELLTGVLFELDVTAPGVDAAGTYLFRALQDYSDGFTAPWVFEGDRYPSPTVAVGGDETVRNGAGSTNEPCFGPAEAPAEGEEPGPAQEPCPSTGTTSTDTTTDASTDTTTDDGAADDTTAGSDTAASGAPDAASAGAADASGDQLPNTGGGAALAALALTGAAATLRRRS